MCSNKTRADITEMRISQELSTCSMRYAHARRLSTSKWWGIRHLLKSSPISGKHITRSSLDLFVSMGFIPRDDFDRKSEQTAFSLEFRNTPPSCDFVWWKSRLYLIESKFSESRERDCRCTGGSWVVRTKSHSSYLWERRITGYICGWEVGTSGRE